MRTLATIILLVAWPLYALAEEVEKPEVPKFEMPSLDLPSLDVPKLDGVKGEKTEGPKAAGAPTTVTFTVGEITVAKGFRTGKGGACLPKGKIDFFQVEQVPINIEPFRTCVRLTATEGVVATVKARIEGPRGKEVADAAGEVSFARRGKDIDYLIDWSGFTAKHAGKDVLSIEVGDEAKGQIELAVKPQTETP